MVVRPVASLVEIVDYGDGHCVHLLGADSHQEWEDNPYFKRLKKPHTFWYRSEGRSPLAAPPLFQNQHEVQHGDVFWHKAADRYQMWMWDNDEAGGSWRSVPIGQEREDGRFLSLTESRLEPSWVAASWFGKRVNACE
ncbi:hypothetical protein TRAPUB_8054 [Trametes pubescens]|uniref:Uncharacterized protein n=1 Tax=Trametes pubescens TaxID=154538 RepID=A0A1M2W6B1_TRAPU|nr:hypothetical protein TRAPUB_8054 [Trametes pubescens]